MPVIRTSETVAPQFRNELVARLALELNADASTHRNQEPVIFENPIPPTDRFFAVVIWSAWQDIPWGQRTSLILDAYRAADGQQPQRPARAPLLATASGLTWDEADENGFFKYGIEAPGAHTAIQAAMLAAGGTETPDGIKLRFLDRRSAQTAVEQLRASLPTVAWQEKRIYADEG